MKEKYLSQPVIPSTSTQKKSQWQNMTKQEIKDSKV